ncbi:hypothetical protein [Draconibacterium mangrovi]|uniref:hypothetical protein n=1 Tax=Draconibacterium mangrovi TaxID=2697469 RepID=UPI0013D497BB|nr:hypothetical protein [Draconibacterium mangrovi]
MEKMKLITKLWIILLIAVQPVFSSAATADLLAGTAKVTITSSSEIPLHDSLYARVLLLKTPEHKLAFVAVDQGIFTSDKLVQRCKEKLGISQILISSSHTHSSGRSDKEYIDSQIIKALQEAEKSMFPARISAGSKTFPQLGFNRLIVREDGHSRESWFSDEHYTSENPERIPFGPVDHDVGVIKVEDLSGNPRAILMNYAMHSDIVCSNYEISADYPGVACRKVEEAFGDDMTCLFVQGAGGDIESLIISSRRKGPDDPFKSDYRTIERVGELLAWETTKLAKNLKAPKEVTSTIKIMKDSLQFKGRFKQDADYNIFISTILINDDIVIATCPGEPFVRLQLELKRKIREAGGTPFLFGYTWFEGTWPNYIPDILAAARGGYGADQSWPEPIAVGAGETIMNKHFENYLRINGLMRTDCGPVGFKGGSQWKITEIPAEEN